jgi:hypothetical protein
VIGCSNLICIGAKEQEVEGDGGHQIDDEPAPGVNCGTIMIKVILLLKKIQYFANLFQ